MRGLPSRSDHLQLRSKWERNRQLSRRFVHLQLEESNVRHYLRRCDDVPIELLWHRSGAADDCRIEHIAEWPLWGRCFDDWRQQYVRPPRQSGQLIGERFGANHFYFQTDERDSTLAVITGDGLTVGDRYGYDPYGRSTYHSGAVANPWGYAGGYTDATGLVKFGARYYAPDLAAFTQADPLLVGNLFQYAGGDPIYHTDRSGPLWCCIVRSYYYWWGTVVVHYVQFYLNHNDIWLLNNWGPWGSGIVALIIGAGAMRSGAGVLIPCQC